MFEQALAEERSILKIKVGSHLYGTNTPTSDEDFVGIFIPTADYLLGLKRIEEVDIGVKNKDEAGKNTADAVDCKFYTLEKFARLALDNNPNIIEILFVNEESVVSIKEIGIQLLSLKKSFLSKNLKHRFLGYAFSQKHKMVIKLDNYETLVEASKYLERCDKRFVLEAVEIDHYPLFVKKKDYVSIGDINLPITSTTKRAKEFVDRRLSQFGSRLELVTKYGYDTKFASHLIRLIVEGIELLSTGDLIFPLKEAPLLRDIRQGKYSMDDVLKMAEEYERAIEVLYESSSLSHSSDFETVQNFVVNTHLNALFQDGVIR